MGHIGGIYTTISGIKKIIYTSLVAEMTGAKFLTSP
jgi:hypothetical protein